MGADQDITIVDSGAGNLQSVCRKLQAMNARVTVSSEPQAIARAKKLVLPGIGHFGQAMARLEELRLVDALNEAVEGRKVPVLGICLGMQLMARRSEEGEKAGLGWIAGDVVRFRVEDPRRFKVPHIGWNSIAVAKDSPLVRDVPNDAEFYFAHSYHLRLDDAAELLAETDYGELFPSAVAKDNVFGVQFHPEKSHDAGERMLKNFAAL